MSLHNPGAAKAIDHGYQWNIKSGVICPEFTGQKTLPLSTKSIFGKQIPTANILYKNNIYQHVKNM